MKISIIIEIITSNIGKKENQKRNKGQHLIARMHANAFWEKKMQHSSGQQLGIQLHAPHSVLPGSMLVDHTTVLPFL